MAMADGMVEKRCEDYVPDSRQGGIQIIDLQRAGATRWAQFRAMDLARTSLGGMTMAGGPRGTSVDDQMEAKPENVSV
jgi:hypothetical protein